MILTQRYEQQENAGKTTGDDKPFVDGTVVKVDINVDADIVGILRSSCSRRRISKYLRHDVETEAGYSQNQRGKKPNQRIPRDFPASTRCIRCCFFPTAAEF